MIKLGILGSTRGTVMLSLLDAINQKQLSAEIVAVISNQADAMILQHAKKHNLVNYFVDPAGYSKKTYDQKLSTILEEKSVDLVVLIGYMKVLSGEFVTKWHKKVINIHPSLLPAFAGLTDLNIHQAVIDANVKQTGCTVHYVTEKIDAGPILIQKKCIVLPNDNAARLKARVQELEAIALMEAIQKYVP